MDITFRPAEIITVPEPLIIENVRDSFQKQKITVSISRIPRDIVLWNGVVEYAAAGNWTNESVLTRLQEVLALPVIPWD